MDSSVDKKLKALQSLQDIDSKLDDIKKVRGDLPEEVQDLEDEIVGYETRIGNFDSKVQELETSISDYKTGIKDAEALIQKYSDQQMNVRNNREYDAITKEIELQKLEVQIMEKRIREAGISIESKKAEIEEVNVSLEDRKKDLENKKVELETIIAESQEEEEKLYAKREKAGKSLEARLFVSYEKIRTNARNGLAVVKVQRNACGGCFNTVPPQRQADIKDRKKLIICEHCGRILADVDFYIEEKPKKKTTRKKKETAKK